MRNYRYKLNIKRPALVVLALVMFLCVVSGCATQGQGQNDVSTVPYPVYSSFRDIPGVDADDIRAIEELQEKYETLGPLIFANAESTEGFLNEQGEVAGFIALLCEWLTDTFEIEFEARIYDWGDLMAGLDSQSIDFTGDLTATEERRQSGYIMTDPVAERVVKVFRIADSVPLFEISDTRPLRYAFLSGTITIDDVSRLAEEDFIVFEIDDYDEAYRMLKANKIDAYIEEGVSEAAFDIYGDVIAYEYLPLIFNPVSMTTKNPELAPIITVVQKALDDDLIRYLTELYNKGEKEYYKNKLLSQLSEEEKEFIANSPTIPFAAEYDNYPVSFYNARENQWQGIAIDVVREIENTTGLSFEIINDYNTEWETVKSMLENGEAHMVTELIRSPDREGLFLWPNKTHVIDYYALLSKSDRPDVKLNEIKYSSIGLVKDTGQTDVFLRWFPNHSNTKIFIAWDDAYDALERGEIDLLMAGMNQLLSLTNFRELAGFKANIVFNQPLESAFGFNIDQKTLRDIVEKSLHLIDIESISDQWTRKTYDYTAKVAQARLPWLVGTSGLLLVVLILVVILMQRNRREGRRLEELVYERTVELELASRAKSDFLANMSHEIRTPMNAIIGMTAIAKSSENMERIVYTVEKIEDASNHLLGVINDILDMSKIEANKFDLSPTEFKFEKMLKRVVNVIGFRMAEKKQSFRVYVDRNISTYLIGDDQRLAQVITNLLGNAVKFTPEEGIISLNTYFVGEENDVCEIKIAVSDTGIGISDEQQSHLFKSFSQAESDTTRKFGGTGLGLSISKNIVELMGGRIWVNSKLGEGSTFTFTFKMKRGKAIQKETPVKVTKWEDTRVLAVDDDPYILADFQGILSLQGISCDVAKDSEEALRLAEEKDGFDVCFIDWRMPGMDGVELVKELQRRNPGHRKSLYVMISAAEIHTIAGEAKEAGVSKFLQKPLFPSSITDIISEHIMPEEDIILNSSDDSFSGVYTGRHILLVEDMEINREIVIALLEPSQLTIDTACDGKEAVRMFEENPGLYDMIFMDVQMPEMDGYEATRKIRAFEAPEAKTIPIVAMTANVFKEDVDKCLEVGMNGHIGKPINIIEVHEIIKKYL